MSHSNYVKIAEQIDQGVCTAPKVNGEFSESFIEYLKLLYTPEEAELVQHLQMGSRFKTAADIAGITGKTEAAVREILDPLAEKAALIGLDGLYVFPPIGAIMNVHQTYLETKPDDVRAAELYHKFFIEEGFYKFYESSMMGTQHMRAIPVEKTIESGQKILSSEDAHAVIQNVSNLALYPCPCRNRKEKLGERECKDKFPIGSCIAMGSTAQIMTSTGLAKTVTAEQAIRYFDEMQELGLVGITDNFEDTDHNIICLCCECCCSQIRGRTRLDNPDGVAPSNFVPRANDDCILCGNCEDRCPFDAITMGDEYAEITADKCLGCGVCVLGCDQDALHLMRVERETSLPTMRALIKKIATENRQAG